MPEKYKKQIHVIKKLMHCTWLSFFIPAIAFAQSTETDLGIAVTFNQFVGDVWAWSAQIVFGVAIIGLIVGGIALTSSGGNEDRADMGRQTIRGSIIGTLIVVFSGVLNRFIKPDATKDPQKLGDVPGALQTASTALISIVGAISAIMIVYAGIKYMTANGEEEKIASAKKALKMAITGAIIALSAWVISDFFISQQS